IAESYTPVANVPDDYILYQNYPNPFNPTTVIRYSLSVESNVTLKVYNILGQEMATLLDHELQDDGEQEVEFDATRFASGVYFYRIVAEGLNEEGERAGNFTAVKKMVLVK